MPDAIPHAHNVRTKRRRFQAYRPPHIMTLRLAATPAPNTRRTGVMNVRLAKTRICGTSDLRWHPPATPSLHKSADTGASDGLTGISPGPEQPVCYSMDTICRSGATFNPKVARSRLARPTTNSQSGRSRWSVIRRGSPASSSWTAPPPDRERMAPLIDGSRRGHR